MSTDVLADVVLPGSPAVSWDLLLTVDDDGRIFEVARDHTGPDVTDQADQQPLGLPSVLGLIRAAVKGDAGSFAAAAAELTHAVVTVIDSGGAIVASGREPGRVRLGVGRESACPARHGPAGPARDILLRDESGLWGAIRLRPAPSAPAYAEALLGDLGLALVKSIHSERRRRTLESQLVILSCLAGGEAERLFRQDGAAAPGTARRLVVIRAPAPMGGYSGARLLDTAVRAAIRTEILSGLCLVMSQGSLVGVYPDTEQSLARHKQSWSQVLRTIGAAGSLTVAVGAATSDIGDFPGQHRIVREIARIQQSGSRYFDLPHVAMLDELGPLAEVLGATPGRGFAPFVERVLGGLLDDRRFGGQLIETLHAYLQTSGSPREAGALLHLHPSTVKYRIRVIRELLGPRLDDRNARLDLELAVRLCLAARLLRKRPAGPASSSATISVQPAADLTKSATAAPRMSPASSGMLCPASARRT